ncbi:hypothetical protein EON67_10075 [archaeon]|nr:MAG: hypothetical protein EON67_10075 [archaeon]
MSDWQPGSAPAAGRPTDAQMRAYRTSRNGGTGVPPRRPRTGGCCAALFNFFCRDRFALASYKKLIAQSPRKHQLFMALVTVQALVLIAERVALISMNTYVNDAELRQAIWFFGVIVLSAFFVFYFAMHAVLAVNVRPLARATRRALRVGACCRPLAHAQHVGFCAHACRLLSSSHFRLHRCCLPCACWWST